METTEGVVGTIKTTPARKVAIPSGAVWGTAAEVTASASSLSTLKTPAWNERFINDINGKGSRGIVTQAEQSFYHWDAKTGLDESATWTQKIFFPSKGTCGHYVLFRRKVGGGGESSTRKRVRGDGEDGAAAGASAGAAPPPFFFDGCGRGGGGGFSSLFSGGGGAKVRRTQQARAPRDDYCSPPHLPSVPTDCQARDGRGRGRGCAAVARRARACGSAVAPEARARGGARQVHHGLQRPRPDCEEGRARLAQVQS